jgi:hypothetical protein
MVELDAVSELLESLLGKEVFSVEAPSFEPHSATLRGLVTDEDNLVAVIGSDLSFAHLSGACLALIPRGRAEDAGDQPDEDLLEVYGEVANVFSRLVNESSSRRVRLDPSMTHEEGDLRSIIASGTAILSAKVDIDKYGKGNVAVWQLGA